MKETGQSFSLNWDIISKRCIFAHFYLKDILQNQPPKNYFLHFVLTVQILKKKKSHLKKLINS